MTVVYATANGTATAGSDYTAKSGTLSFAAGETSKTIDVLAHWRHASRNRRDVSRSPDLGHRRDDRDRASTGTIVERRSAAAALPTFSIGNATVTEGNSGTVNMIFTVTLVAGVDERGDRAICDGRRHRDRRQRLQRRQRHADLRGGRDHARPSPSRCAATRWSKAPKRSACC